MAEELKIPSVKLRISEIMTLVLSSRMTTKSEITSRRKTVRNVRRIALITVFLMQQAAI